MYNSEELFGKASNQIIHDIRNYLNSIIGFSSLLENNKNLGSEELLYISKISSSGSSIEKLLSNISDFINYDFDISVKKINLNDFIITFFKKFKQAFIERNIKINFYLNDSIDIKTSYEILEKIFDNLIEFSLKGLRGSNEKRIDIAVEISKDKSIIIYYSDSSSPIMIQKEYFNADEILSSKRGLFLFFMQKYTSLLKGKIFYFDSEKWNKETSRVEKINKTHGFKIELPNI